MNKLSHLFLALTTVATVGASAPAHAIELTHPPIGGPGPIALPDRCPNQTPNAKKDFHIVGTEKTVLGKKFNMGVDGQLAFTVDCRHAAVTGSLALTGKLASITVKPVEVKLEASTDSNDRSAVMLEFVTFGRKVGGTTIAETTAPINFSESLDMDPVPAAARSGSWDASETYQGVLVEAHAGYELNAVGGAWLTARINENRFEINVVTAATIGGHAQASVSGSYEGFTAEASGVGALYVAKFVGVAYARLKKQAVPGGGQHWVASAELSQSFDYLLEGKMRVLLDLILKEINYPIFDLADQAPEPSSLEFSQDLGVDKPF